MNMDRSPVQVVPTAAECTASSGNDQEYRAATCTECNGPIWRNRLDPPPTTSAPTVCPGCSPFGA